MRMLARRPWLRFFTDAGDGSGGAGGGTGNGDGDQGTGTGTGQSDSGGDEKLGEAGLRALQAERAARAAAEKTAADALAKVQEMENAKLSDLERAQNEAAAAKAAAEQATATALRYEVAAEKGLPLALAARLQGSTKEELAADAESLKALVGTGERRLPGPDHTQGSGGGDSKKTGSVSAGADLWNEMHPSKK